MMKAIFTRTALALVAVVTLMASAQAESLRTIRIGVPDQSAGSKPFIEGPVGMAFIRHQLEAVFKPQGVEVQWQFFKGAGPAVNEALANRQLDFVYLGDLAAIIGKANGLPTRLLLGSRGSESYLAVTRASAITQLADLKGKRVAVYRGTADQLAFDRALQTVGLSERNMQVINLDWSAGKAALAAGRVDAVWGGVSLLALRGDKIDVVVKSGDSGRQNTTQAGFLGTQDFIQAWPQATQQVIDVLVKTRRKSATRRIARPGRRRWRSRAKFRRRCSLRICSRRISTSALRRASTPSWPTASAAASSRPKQVASFATPLR